MNTKTELTNATTAADLIAVWPSVNAARLAGDKKTLAAWKKKAKPLAGFDSKEKPVCAVVLHVLKRKAAEAELTAAVKLRKQIDALVANKRALAALNVSEYALDAIQTAIDELEDAFIAEVNAENAQ